MQRFHCLVTTANASSRLIVKVGRKPNRLQRSSYSAGKKTCWRSCCTRETAKHRCYILCC